MGKLVPGMANPTDPNGAIQASEGKKMANFDLVVRGGRVATPSEVVECDIGIADGKIAELGRGLGGGDREIEAADRLVLPGGIDSHCHIEQLSSAGVMNADDFYSGTVSAAFGGTTTVIPFAAQHRGMSVTATVEAYHERAGPKAVIDYAFHLHNGGRIKLYRQ